MSDAGKGPHDYYADGDWNAICFECGGKRKASTMRKHWQGYYVCPRCWEPRQPQDFVRGAPDVQAPPWTQPVPAPHFVETAGLITEASDNVIGDDFIRTEINEIILLET